MKNIVLIGMPGSGKTTISQALADKTGWPLIDLDEYLVANQQMTITEMFRISEDFFRDQETQVCRTLKDCEATILSCGGGVVLRSANMAYLKENGLLCWLTRDLDKIMADVDISGRPLLQAGRQKLYELARERMPLYRQYADIIIDNNGSIEQTIAQILPYMEEKRTNLQ